MKLLTILAVAFVTVALGILFGSCALIAWSMWRGESD